MTLIGIDYGRKRTGLAVYREGLVLPAEPVLGTWRDILWRLRDFEKQYEDIEVVLGIPLSAGGRQTEMSKEVLKLGDWLKLAGYRVELINEVSSSKDAALLIGKKDRKGHMDSLAACEILKRYLVAQ